MKNSTPKHIGNSITSVLHRLGIGKKLKRYEIFDLWPEIVGTQIAQVTKVDYIDGGKLFVSVSRATWRNELMFLKKELIDKINKALQEHIIDDIIFR